MKESALMSKGNKIPDEIKQYLPCKSTRIRKDGDTYRVTKYEAYKTPSGKWSSGHEKLIGKIIPGVGFCPNKYYKKLMEEQKQVVSSDRITDLSYGKYALLDTLCCDVHKMLQACFTLERAAQIYAFAMIIAANSYLHIDQINDYYQESFLCYMFHDYSFKMGYTALTSLLHDLGSREDPVRQFEQGLIDSSSHDVAIDGHVIRSCSEENGLADRGYKFSQLGAEQVNLLIAYDIRNCRPLAYRSFRGSKPDKSSVIDFLNNRHFTDTKFVVDKGFYSHQVLSLMSKDGNRYIIPVPANNKHYKQMIEDVKFSSGEFVYRAGKKDPSRVEYFEKEVSPGHRIIFFRNIDENNSTRKSYMIRMSMGEEGYTQQGYDEHCGWWGFIALETNTDEPAKQVYEDYKDRWTIETYNNYIKNDGRFCDLKIQDYYVKKGFDFIMLVSGLMHSRLLETVRNLHKSDVSAHDVISKASHLRLVLNGNKWHLNPLNSNAL